MRRAWTEEETKLLFTNLTNEEIAKKVKRTVEAVRSKRYKTTGRYVNFDVPKPTKIVKENKMGLARILKMAKILGVKIICKGERK